MESPEKIQIIILAAGRGVRMESSEPKALTPLRGKPFLEHILETVKTLNLPAEPIIVVGHKKERILEVFGEKYNYAHQAEQLGTGHAVLSAKNHINKNHEIILVLSADQPLISRETILQIIKKHRENKPAITLTTVNLPDFEDWRSLLLHFGRIIRDKNNKIEKIVEFKDATDEEKKSTEVNGAVYAFDNVWLWENIDKIKNENIKKEYYLTDLIKIANEQGKNIETVSMQNMLEILQPNNKEELDILEKLAV